MNEETIISMFAAVFLAVIKNPQKKAAVKKIALKIFKSIRAAYAGDPDFDQTS